VDARAGQHVRADQRHQWRQRGRAGADPAAEGRDVEMDVLTGVSLALPVQRQVLPELRLQDHRQQLGPGTPAGDRVERRRRLGDRLARPAGEFLPNRLDHLPLPWDHLERLGDCLAKLGQFALAAWTFSWARDDDPLARQMRRQGTADRLGARASVARLGGRFRVRGLRLGGLGLKLLKLQLELVQEPAAALGGRAEAVALQLGNQQLEVCDHRFRTRSPRLGVVPSGTLGHQRRA
jgi:hypothetical protein